VPNAPQRGWFRVLAVVGRDDRFHPGADFQTATASATEHSPRSCRIGRQLTIAFA